MNNIKYMFLLLFIFLTHCGNPTNPRHLVAPNDVVRSPFIPPVILPCESGNRIGYWVDDCSTPWCLPGDDIETFYSVNLGYLMAYSIKPNIVYGASKEVNNTKCGTEITPWRVWKLAPSTYGDLSMVDPVRLCVGTSCTQVITNGWAQFHTEYKLYFIEEIFSSEL